jgi:purine-binding chemotaxis protein CheW
MNSNAVTAPNANAAHQMSQWVTFSLEGETYGVNVMHVQEVLKLTDIAPVPGAPVYVLGIINLRGNVVTVVDTRRLFGLPQQEANDLTRIVILEVDKQVVGILVDSVTEVVELDGSQVESPPTVGAEEGGRYIHGVHSDGERLIILVDLSRVLAADRLSEANPMASARGARV